MKLSGVRLIGPWTCQCCVQLEGPWKDHVWAILGPWFDHFFNIFTSRCMKWIKFSLESHAYQIEECHSVSNYWDNIRAMFGPHYGHVWAISIIYLYLDAWNGSFFHQRVLLAKSEIIVDVYFLEPYWGHVWAIIGQCFGYFYKIYASRCPKWLKFLLKSHACQTEECW